MRHALSNPVLVPLFAMTGVLFAAKLNAGWLGTLASMMLCAVVGTIVIAWVQNKPDAPRATTPPSTLRSFALRGLLLVAFAIVLWMAPDEICHMIQRSLAPTFPKLNVSLQSRGDMTLYTIEEETANPFMRNGTAIVLQDVTITNQTDAPIALLMGLFVPLPNNAGSALLAADIGPFPAICKPPSGCPQGQLLPRVINLEPKHGTNGYAYFFIENDRIARVGIHNDYLAGTLSVRLVDQTTGREREYRWPADTTFMHQ